MDEKVSDNMKKEKFLEIMKKKKEKMDNNNNSLKEEIQEVKTKNKKRYPSNPIIN